MAKQKSAKALEKEEQVRAAVAQRTQQFASNGLPTFVPERYFAPQFVGKPLKSLHPDVIVRNGKLVPQRAGLARAIKALHGGGGFKYIIGPAKTSVIHADVTSQYVLSSGLRVDPVYYGIYKLPEFPYNWILEQNIWTDAYVISVPDDLGRVKAYMHKDSYLAHKADWYMYKGKVDLLNRKKLETATSWEILGDYLGTDDPKQRTICDIVKAISRNISQQELDKMIQENA